MTDEAVNRAEHLVKSVHDLSHRLHPAKLRLIGLVAALRDLQHEMSQSHVPITFTHDNVPSTLPLEVTLCVFRIVQEALQNALKHSHATEVAVHLSGSTTGLQTFDFTDQAASKVRYVGHGYTVNAGGDKDGL